MTDLQAMFRELQVKLNERHFERYDEIEIVLAACLTKEHVVFIGPPGTAKSMLARDIVETFQGATIFEYLYTKFTTPEEIFGPFDLRLLQEGQYKRITRGKLPEAHVAYEDEIFKANSPIQNARLTVMNERLFDNGTERVKVPLITTIGASNEMPEGEELNAIFDRYMYRKHVRYIHEPSNFVEMLRSPEQASLPNLYLDDLLAAIAAVEQVIIPETIYETYVQIRGDLQLEGITVSDRRFKKSLKALQAMAWLAERDHVNDDDFRILQHVLWTAPQEEKKVTRVVLNHTNPLEIEALAIIDAADEIAGDLAAALMDAKSKGVEPKDALMDQGIEWFTTMRNLGADVKKLEQKAKLANKPLNRVKIARDRIVSVAEEIHRHTIGVGRASLNLKID